jgi:hypothetical protein
MRAHLLPEQAAKRSEALEVAAREAGEDVAVGRTHEGAQAHGDRRCGGRPLVLVLRCCLIFLQGLHCGAVDTRTGAAA